MKKFLASLLFALAVLPTMATAGEATITCTKPTKNTDGTTLTDLGGLRYLWGPSFEELNSGTYVDGATLPCEYKVTGLTSGTWYFAVIAYKTNGMESALSNVVSKVVSDTLPEPAPPLPPSTVVIKLEVYQVISTTDRFQFLPVGTVPGNTQCIGTQTINGYFAVPVSAVTWYGNVRPKVVVAQCR